ncbi:MAG: hypothetical protein VB078_02455 [Clostridiaceae bacterium]|nr:hypothetical protein [Clostridiaceae bacterium]
MYSNENNDVGSMSTCGCARLGVILRKRISRPLAYVCCSESISVVDLLELRRMFRIPCGDGSQPYNIVINPIENYAYVADYALDRILTVDLTYNVIVNEVSVGGSPKSLAISPCGRFLYVVFDDAPLMQVFSTSTLELLWQISLPASSASISVTTLGEIACVTQPSINKTAVINLRRRMVIWMLDTHDGPGCTAVSPYHPVLLVGGNESDDVTPVNTLGMLIGDSISLENASSGVSYIGDGKSCLVAIPEKNAATVVDLVRQQTFRRIPTGDLPGGVAASLIYPLAVVCNQGDATLTVISTKTFSATDDVDVGTNPTGVAIFE